MNTIPLSKSQKRRRKRDQKKSQRTLLQKITRAFGTVLIALILLLAVLVGIGRAYIEANPHIKDELTQKLALRLGVGLKVEDVGVRWRWSGPQVTISKLEFQDPQSNNTLLTFDSAQVILDFKRYVKTRIVGVSAVHLQGSDLVLQRRTGNTLFFNGVELSEIKKLFTTDKSSDELDATEVNSNYPKGVFKFDDINFLYQDALTNKEIRFDKINTEINNNEQLLRLEISADAGKLADNLKLTLSTPNPELHNNLAWQVLFEANKLELPELTTQWVNLKPLLFPQQSPGFQAQNDILKFSSGSSDIKMFMNYADNSIKTMNGTLDFNKLKFARNEVDVEKYLNGLDFRFSYDNQNNLTSFLIDNIAVDGVPSNWPEVNALQFKRLMHSDTQIENIEPIQREIQSESTSEKHELESSIEATTEGTNEELSEINRSIVLTVAENKQANTLFKNIELAELKSNYLNLGEISPMLEVVSGFIPNLKALKGIDWQEIEGITRDINVELDNPKNEDLSLGDLTAALEFEGLSIPSINESASLSGLSGKLNYANKQGILNIDSTSLIYENLNIFRNEFSLDTLTSIFNINYDLGKWHFESDNLQIENQDFLLNSNLDILWLKGESPIVDIQGQSKPKVLDRVKFYYPAKIMNEKTLAWLEDRVSGGTVESANFILKGALKDYPYRNKKGEYLVEFNVQNLDVDYADGWPAVRLENADVLFKNETFNINASRVKTGNLASFPFQAGFQDLGKSPLTLGIDTNVDVLKVREWIDSSPLRDSVGESLKSIKVSGQAHSKLDISLPLASPSDLTLKGQIDFVDSELKLDAFDDIFTNLNGKLNYTKDVFYSDKLNAIYQGRDIQAVIKPLDQDTLIVLNAETNLGSFLGEEFSTYVTGSSKVDAEVVISGQKGVGINNIKLRSNLLGSGLVLPAPFVKTEDSIMPLNLNIDVLKFSQPSQREQMRMSGNVGDNLLRVRLDSTLDNLDADWSLRSIAIVGGTDASLFDSINLDTPRVNVFGNFSYVDFDEWLDFFNNDSNSATNEALEIGTISVKLKQLDAIGQSFPDTQVDLLPSLDEWNATIKNAQVDGKIKFPRPWLNESLIEANLNKYHLILPEGKTEEISFDPREIPNVSITVKDFQLATMPMGQTSLRIKKESNGARIENFKINNSNFDIDGSGGWFRTNQGETSLVSIELKSSDLESTLKQLGYAPAASAKSAVALIELDWPGSPFTDILQNVSGSISFKLLNGDIREVDPGAGRFLALLSIAQLPKRLSLDFRDVFNSGLHYDELSADFTIHRGQAYTNNMLMRGPVADLGVVGRVGLATRDFEQAAVVQADLGSSLPIAGALAGGLGVGAALLIFSEIFKNPLKQATQVFYKIDGEWSNPKIERALPQDLEEIPIAPR